MTIPKPPTPTLDVKMRRVAVAAPPRRKRMTQSRMVAGKAAGQVMARAWTTLPTTTQWRAMTIKEFPALNSAD